LYLATEIFFLKDDVVKAESFNFSGVGEQPAFAETVKRKWRERLESRGIRLVLAPGPRVRRRKETYDNISVHSLACRR
jgi:hypothetical protein